MKTIDVKKDFVINVLYYSFLIALVAGLLKFTGRYMMPFVVGFVIAFMLKPFIRRLHHRFGEKKWISLLAILLFYALFAFLAFWLFVSVAAGIQKLAQVIPGFYNDLLYPFVIDTINKMSVFLDGLDPEVLSVIDDVTVSILQSLDGLFKMISSGALNLLTKFVAAVPSLLVSILIAIISSFFFTMDYQPIVNKVVSFLPDRSRELVFDIKDGMVSTLGKYGKAYLKIMSLTFVELSIGFLIIGIENPIGLAALIAMVDILPVLGTGGFMIPWVFVELLKGDVSLALALFVLYMIVTIIRNIVEPKIVGDQIGLHPLTTLISIYVGVKVFGFWGLLGMPIAITIVKTLHDEGKINIFRQIKNKSVDNAS